MKISLGSWAFSFGPYADHPVPFDKTVERLSSAGYDGVEICGFPPHITLENYATPESRRQVVNLLRQNGLGISGYVADFSCVNPLVPANRQKYLDLFQHNLELAVDLGSPSIRVDTVAAPGSVEEGDYRAAMGRLIDLWRDAAALAQTAGVRMVWEFEPGFAFNKPSEILAIHQQVGHPNFYILFDTCHAYMCAVVGARQHGPREVLPGGVAEFLRKLEGRIGAVHVIDSDGTLHGDETSTHRPFGEGHIPFKTVTPLLLAIPNIEWWCIDLCFWAGSWELVEPSRRYVADLLASQAVLK